MVAARFLRAAAGAGCATISLSPAAAPTACPRAARSGGPIGREAEPLFRALDAEIEAGMKAHAIAGATVGVLLNGQEHLKGCRVKGQGPWPTRAAPAHQPPGEPGMENLTGGEGGPGRLHRDAPANKPNPRCGPRGERGGFGIFFLRPTGRGLGSSEAYPDPNSRSAPRHPLGPQLQRFLPRPSSQAPAPVPPPRSCVNPLGEGAFGDGDGDSPLQVSSWFSHSR